MHWGGTASRQRWGLIIGGAVFLAIVVLLITLAAFDSARDKLGEALVGAALEIAFVGLVGGVLAGAIQQEMASAAAILEQNRRLNEARLQLLSDVVTAYYRIKDVRRTLRAAGFANPSGRRLEPWQIAAYHTQMAEISRAELSLGRIERELGVNPSQLSNLDVIKGHVSAVADYLDEIIDGWELHAVAIGQGKVDAVTAQIKLAHLLTYDDANPDSFGSAIAPHMNAIEAEIRREIKAALPAA